MHNLSRSGKPCLRLGPDISGLMTPAVSTWKEREPSGDGEGADPFTGEPGELHQEPETRLETIVPAPLLGKVLRPAGQLIPTRRWLMIFIPWRISPWNGMGVVGELKIPWMKKIFWLWSKTVFPRGDQALRIAWQNLYERWPSAEGQVAFLLRKAMALGADVFLTGDVKYHQFFDAKAGSFSWISGILKVSSLRGSFFMIYLRKNSLNLQSVYRKQRQIQLNIISSWRKQKKAQRLQK